VGKTLDYSAEILLFARTKPSKSSKV